MKALYLIIAGLLINCTDHKNNTQNEVIVKHEKTPAFMLKGSLINLSGTAQEISNNWKQMQEFTTSLENYDHSLSSTEIVVSHIEDMKITLPEEFNQPSIKGRLKVVETRFKSYQSYLNYNHIDRKEQEKRYNAILIAIDEFKIQLLDEINEQLQREDLLNKIKQLDSISQQDKN